MSLDRLNENAQSRTSCCHLVAQPAVRLTALSADLLLVFACAVRVARLGVRFARMRSSCRCASLVVVSECGEGCTWGSVRAPIPGRPVVSHKVLIASAAQASDRLGGAGISMRCGAR